MQTMKRFLILALALTACFRPVTPAESLSGTWTLVSMNGQPLPYLADPVTKLKITDGTLIFQDDGTFQGISRYSEPTNPIFLTAQIVVGIYNVKGSTLTVRVSKDFYPVAPNGETALRYQAGVITANRSGVTATYVQQ